MDHLEFIIRTSFSSESEALPLYTNDDWWSGFNAPSGSHAQAGVATYEPGTSQANALGHHGGSSKNIPLATLAMHQRAANTSLMVEHFHLATCLQLTIVFSLKNVHPLSLFPSSVRMHLFRDLVSFPTENKSQDREPELLQKRTKFVCDSVTGLVQSLPVHTNGRPRVTFQKNLELTNFHLRL